MGNYTPWEYEIGCSSTAPNKPELLSESSSNPFVYRKDSKTHFVWRIRNAIWPKDVYQLSIDEKENKLVLKTTNKK